ncbi:hypothetical protein Tco_0564609 [Tanacetum coccineum]
MAYLTFFSNTAYLFSRLILLYDKEFNKGTIYIKDLEREFCSSRKLFTTLGLEESRSHVFDLFSDLAKNSEEEVAETLAETMKEYMIKTRADYGSGVTRPKIDDKDHFELKG